MYDKLDEIAGGSKGGQGRGRKEGEGGVDHVGRALWQAGAGKGSGRTEKTLFK